MSAEIAHLFARLPDLSPTQAGPAWRGVEPDFLRDWLGRRAQNEWRAMPSAQAILRFPKMLKGVG